jgi:hypothetical protein
MGHVHVHTLLKIENKSATVNAPTVVLPQLAKEPVGLYERGLENGDQGHKVRFELNPDRQTTDRKKSQATTDHGKKENSCYCQKLR